jgi:hypothetical protein
MLPSVSVEPVADSDVVKGTVPLVGVAVRAAVGG